MSKNSKNSSSNKEERLEKVDVQDKSDELDRKLTSDELELEVGSVDPDKGGKTGEVERKTSDNKDNRNDREDKDKEHHESKENRVREVEEDELEDYNLHEDEDGFDDESNIYENKNKGNKLFSEGDLDGAIKLWSKSINSLSYILNRSRNDKHEGVTLDSLHEYTSLYVTLCLNLSLAHLKKEEYDKCKQYCQYVLMYEEKNLKAHLRIVKADLKLNNYRRALCNCEKGLEYNPDDSELLFLKKSILEQQKKYKQVEKGFYSKAFKKLEPDPRSEEDPLEKLMRSKFFKFNYTLMMFFYNAFLSLKKVWKFVTVVVNFVFDSIEYVVDSVVGFFNKVRSKLKRD